MQEKTDRKALISRIVNSGRVHTQDELVQVLASMGVRLTQATLSRDMKQLGAFKFSGPDGDSYYRIPTGKPSSPLGSTISIECSGQLCVLHCHPGFASAIGAVLDHNNVEGVMGCIAGDDTVLVILKEGADCDTIKENIKVLI